MVFRKQMRDSTFLQHRDAAEDGSLGILHLKRDSVLAVDLHGQDLAGSGYAEGQVVTTRFGSFPHSILIGAPWGGQIRASSVDTGSRGRKNAKRKHDAIASETRDTEALTVPKAATTAATGFAHLLPPTVELWTASLPHRTQVVYTPDYSYILQRLHVRPGSSVIEAGAGSGSFTHAAARAVAGRPSGRVWSFEFHELRAQKLRAEIQAHELDKIVRVQHRDVYEQGFQVDEGAVQADAIFLDLPAPWLALRHLTRAGPLNARAAVHICCFSPCLEQGQRNVQSLREQGWIEIEMVEISARRLEVRRDVIGTKFEGLRGINPSVANVEEALEGLREVERRTQRFHSNTSDTRARPGESKHVDFTPKLHLEGKIVHRSEPELKTHTSYLIFGILPRSATDPVDNAAKAAAAVAQ